MLLLDVRVRRGRFFRGRRYLLARAVQKKMVHDERLGYIAERSFLPEAKGQFGFVMVAERRVEHPRLDERLLIDQQCRGDAGARVQKRAVFPFEYLLVELRAGVPFDERVASFSIDVHPFCEACCANAIGVLIELRNLLGDLLGQPHVVVVQKGDVLAARRFDAYIARVICPPGVLLLYPYVHDLRALHGQRRAMGLRPVFRCVVHHDDFMEGIGLIQGALHGALQQLHAVFGGDYR